MGAPNRNYELYKKLKVSVKFCPRTGHRGPEGEYRCNYTLSVTTALDGVYGQRQGPADLPPGKGSGNHCTGGWVGSKAALDG